MHYQYVVAQILSSRSSKAIRGTVLGKAVRRGAVINAKGNFRPLVWTCAPGGETSRVPD